MGLLNSRCLEHNPTEHVIACRCICITLALTVLQTHAFAGQASQSIAWPSSIVWRLQQGSGKLNEGRVRLRPALCGLLSSAARQAAASLQYLQSLISLAAKPQLTATVALTVAAEMHSMHRPSAW